MDIKNTFFTDPEYRLMLSALSRERKVCESLDVGACGAPVLMQAISSIEKKIHDLNYTRSWIPCKVKMPKNDVIVLVTCRAKKGTLSVNRAYYDGTSWHGSGSMAEVVAWMALPEPYDDGGGLNEE